jgi:hypothetical protein
MSRRCSSGCVSNDGALISVQILSASEAVEVVSRIGDRGLVVVGEELIVEDVAGVLEAVIVDAFEQAAAPATTRQTRTPRAVAVRIPEVSADRPFDLSARLLASPSQQCLPGTFNQAPEPEF